MMMYISADKKLVGYSLELEILCTLPQHPSTVPLKEIVEDFGLRTQGDVMDKINILRTRGLNIVTTNDDSVGRVAAVSRESWKKSQAIGLDYWTKVHM